MRNKTVLLDPEAGAWQAYLPPPPPPPAITITIFLMLRESGGSGAVVKAACLESRRSRFHDPAQAFKFKKTNCIFSSHS